MVCQEGKRQILKVVFVVLIIFFSGLLSPEFFFRPVLGEVVDISVIVTVCGNGIVEAGEACDDGNSLNTDACLNTCQSATCGDGYVWSGAEECDDGNTASGDGCSSSCTTEVAAPPPSGGGGGGGVYIPPVVTKVILQGMAYPGAEITVLIDGQVATIITASSLANFKVELTTLSAGTYTFGLWAEDKEGRRSITFSFTTNVESGKATTISNIFIPPTIELEKVNLLRGEDLKIMGQTAPESQVSIHIGSPQEIVKETVSDERGDWDHIFGTGALDEGFHTARAKAKTSDGLLSSFSKVLGFFIGKYGTAEVCPRADFNKDGKTNLVDFSILLYWWGKYNPCVDQSQNGIVDLADFSILMYWWSG